MEDSDPQVRYQLAFTLGSNKDKTVPLGILLLRHSDDPWMRAAILSSLDTPQDDGSAAAKVFAAIADAPHAPLVDLARMIATQGNTSAIATVLQSLSKSVEQTLAVAAALADGLKRSQRTLSDDVPQDLWQKLADEAGRVTTDAAQPLAVRKEAVGFLANGDSPKPLLALIAS